MKETLIVVAIAVAGMALGVGAKAYMAKKNAPTPAA